MRPLRFLAILAFFAILALLAAPAGHALDVPPAPTRWVTDRAGVLSTTAVSILDAKLENFEQTSGAQFLIYIFPSLEGEAVEDFTIRSVEKWKVGQKKYDNGLVLFVFVKERVVRIEVGYGLEGTITDAFSSRVIRQLVAPHFQQGQYGAGLTAAADGIIKKIQTGEEPVPPLNPRNTAERAPQGSGGGESAGGFDIGTLVFLAIIFFFFILPVLSRRRSGCGGCIVPLMFSGGGGGITFGGGGGGWSGGGGGGFSGGGGSFGGGGATGGW